LAQPRTHLTLTAALAVLAAVLTVACGLLPDSSSSSSSGSTTAPSTAGTTTFSGTLGVQSSSFISFTVGSAGTVSVTLASLSPAVTAGVGLGLGTPNGTTSCSMTNSVSNAQPSSAAQLTVPAAAGTYCAVVFDPGSLTTATAFSLSVTHP
jgi:hypothetical protein